MSVLINGLTLVVPRVLVDVRFPGGADGLRDALSSLDAPPRYVCTSDRHLVTAAYESNREVEPVRDLLEAKGIIVDELDHFPDATIAYPGSLPTRFGWLATARHREGFVHGWPRATGAGPTAAVPEAWNSIVLDPVDVNPGTTFGRDARPAFPLTEKHMEVLARWQKEREDAAVLNGFDDDEDEDDEDEDDEVDGDELDDDDYYVDDIDKDALRLFRAARMLASRNRWPFQQWLHSANFRAMSGHRRYDINAGGTSIPELSCSFARRIPAGRRMAVLEQVWLRNAGLGNRPDAGRFMLDVKGQRLTLKRHISISIDGPDAELEAEFERQIMSAIAACDAFRDEVMPFGVGAKVRSI